MKKIFICFLCTLLYTSFVLGSVPLKDSLIMIRVPVSKSNVKMSDIKTVQKGDWSKLFRIPEHPAFDILLDKDTESKLLTEINDRRKQLNKDTLLTADIFYIWKPYFEWLRNEDPHYRIYTMPDVSREDYKSPRKFNKDKKHRRLPFNILNINDTIVVYQSFDPLFKKGDVIMSINDVPIAEYIKYSYSDRYSTPLQLMLYYYFQFAVDSYDIKVLRAGEIIDIETNGRSIEWVESHLRKEEYNPKILEGTSCGYIQIKNFYPDNSRLIKIVRSAIQDFKDKGCHNVILDLRRNQGGYGHAFDKLLSIFINAPKIPYIKSQKLKVSQYTLKDYDFVTPDMMGQLVEIPDDYLIKEAKLHPKMYIDGMNYYVLISENTGSIAASFVNILQYNEAAKLAGEPLLRNALKYGEVIVGDDYVVTPLLIPISISTVEIDEYTKAVDGVLTPDIHIPFVASEYMTGKDAVLEKLVIIIENSE